MNGLKNIQEKILSDAKAQADEITLAAQQKAAQLLEQTMQDADKAAGEISKDSSKKAEAIVKSAESSAQLQGKNRILKAKSDAMSKIIDEAHRSILAMPDKEYFNIITKMVISCAHNEEGQMLLNKKDLARLPKDFEQQLNGKIKGTLKISDKPCEIDGGFVLVYGGIEENCSFESLFRAKNDRIRDDISSVLFR